MDPRHAWLDKLAEEHRLRYAFNGDRESWLALSKQVRRNVAQLEEHNAKPVGKDWIPALEELLSVLSNRGGDVKKTATEERTYTLEELVGTAEPPKFRHIIPLPVGQTGPTLCGLIRTSKRTLDDPNINDGIPFCPECFYEARMMGLL